MAEKNNLINNNNIIKIAQNYYVRTIRCLSYITTAHIFIYILSIIFFLNPVESAIIDYWNTCIFYYSSIVLFFSIFYWFYMILKQSGKGYHQRFVQRGLRFGVMLFIITEVIFFFWIFFHMSFLPQYILCCNVTLFLINYLVIAYKYIFINIIDIISLIFSNNIMGADPLFDQKYTENLNNIKYVRIKSWKSINWSIYYDNFVNKACGLPYFPNYPKPNTTGLAIPYNSAFFVGTIDLFDAVNNCCNLYAQQHEYFKIYIQQFEKFENFYYVNDIDFDENYFKELFHFQDAICLHKTYLINPGCVKFGALLKEIIGEGASGITLVDPKFARLLGYYW